MDSSNSQPGDTGDNYSRPPPSPPQSSLSAPSTPSSYSDSHSHLYSPTPFTSSPPHSQSPLSPGSTRCSTPPSPADWFPPSALGLITETRFPEEIVLLFLDKLLHLPNPSHLRNLLHASPAHYRLFRQCGRGMLIESIKLWRRAQATEMAKTADGPSSFNTYFDIVEEQGITDSDIYDLWAEWATRWGCGFGEFGWRAMRDTFKKGSQEEMIVKTFIYGNEWGQWRHIPGKTEEGEKAGDLEGEERERKWLEWRAEEMEEEEEEEEEEDGLEDGLEDGEEDEDEEVVVGRNQWRKAEEVDAEDEDMGIRKRRRVV